MSLYRRFHDRFGTAGVALGVIALVLALGSTALAASGALTSKQKKEVEKIAKKVAKPGPPGAAGAQGPAGPAGKDGAAGSAGAKGATGPKGPTGTHGTNGTNGAKGATGATGFSGFTKTLPKGKTETGTFAISSYEIPEFREMVLPISFSIPLEAPGEAFFLNHTETQNSATNPNGCTGTVEKPTAPEGVLCVYTAEEGRTNYEPPEIRFNGVEDEYEPTGTLLRFFHGENGAEPSLLTVNGSWAVTAP